MGENPVFKPVCVTNRPLLSAVFFARPQAGPRPVIACQYLRRSMAWIACTPCRNARFAIARSAMTYPDLLILRHGETLWNRAGRMQGSADSPLTALGRQQAAAQGRLLSAFDAGAFQIWTSPQGRAVETAQIALPGQKRSIRHDSRLAEIAMGDWTGVERSEIRRQVPHLFEKGENLIWYDHAPGGEGLEALYMRTGSFLADLAQPAILFTHGITSRMLRCHALGLERDRFADLPGGQGVIYFLRGGEQTCLAE